MADDFILIRLDANIFNPETKLLFAIQKMWVLIRHRKGLIATNCLRKFENCKASPTHHLYTFLANKKIK